jgi:acyl dehydratase
MVGSATSLIPAESLAMVGKELGEPATGTVSPRESQRFARAVGDLNAIYFDEASAKAAGYRTLVAPPTFLPFVVVREGTLDQVRQDGLYRTGTRSVSLNVKRVMFGGEEWDFLEPVYAGDRITAQPRLLSLEQKEGSSGPFVLMATETTYTNQHGTVVARSRGRSIAR